MLYYHHKEVHGKIFQGQFFVDSKCEIKFLPIKESLKTKFPITLCEWKDYTKEIV